MLNLIKEASGRIRGALEPTPLIYSSSFSSSFGFDCYLKLENLQKTGSFKVRGAYSRISSLSEDEKRRGVVTASSGNHAQGVAWAAGLLGVKSVVVMPETSSIIKRVAARSYGAEVVIEGRFFDEAHARALGMAEKEGLTFIPPFDDELVIAGQGSIGLEIMEQLPEVDTVVVPVGGGGLIAGISAAVKGVKRDATVIGVEAERSRTCIESLKAGRPVDVPVTSTIADGIAVKRVGEKTLPVIREYVDDVVSVGEETIAEAILKFLERKKLVVEGAGAVTLAAAMEGKIPRRTKKAVLVVSGGNIDVTTLDRVIRMGLFKEGRVMKIQTVIPDVPGSLAGLASVIAGVRANILQIFHHREAVEVPVGSAGLEIILEVEGPEHAAEVSRGLKEKGYRV